MTFYDRLTLRLLRRPVESTAPFLQKSFQGRDPLRGIQEKVGQHIEQPAFDVVHRRTSVSGTPKVGTAEEGK